MYVTYVEPYLGSNYLCDLNFETQSPTDAMTHSNVPQNEYMY